MTADTKIYVKDASVARSRREEAKPGPLPGKTFRSQANGLVYWSTSEHPSKPLPPVNVHAGRSAAVDRYLDRPVGFQNSSPLSGFSQWEIDAAIDEAASRHNVEANLVRARVKVKMNVNPSAVSGKEAMELMQFVPQTTRQMKLPNPFKPEAIIDAGMWPLRSCPTPVAATCG